MVSNCGWLIDPEPIRESAADPKIHVLEVGLEPLIQRPDFLKEAAAKQRGGHGSDPNLSRLIPKRPIRLAGATAVSAPGSGDRIERPVDATGIRSHQRLPCREGCCLLFGRSQQIREPLR